MIMENKKKMAAVLAAVTAYIKTEEEMAAGIGVIEAPPVTYTHTGVWGASGRQAQMQLRNLMQLRTFHGSRLR